MGTGFVYINNRFDKDFSVTYDITILDSRGSGFSTLNSDFRNLMSTLRDGLGNDLDAKYVLGFSSCRPIGDDFITHSTVLGVLGTHNRARFWKRRAGEAREQLNAVGGPAETKVEAELVSIKRSYLRKLARDVERIDS